MGTAEPPKALGGGVAELGAITGLAALVTAGQ